MQEDRFGKFVEILENTPGKLGSLLERRSEEQLRYQPSKGAFSLKANLLHLRDLEREGYGRRLRVILAEDLPVLQEIDGERLSRLRHYQAADAALALRQFRLLREANLAYLRNMTGFQWHRKALWNNAEVTLFQVVERWAAHDQEHLEAMEQLAKGSHGGETDR